VRGKFHPRVYSRHQGIGLCNCGLVDDGIAHCIEAAIGIRPFGSMISLDRFPRTAPNLVHDLFSVCHGENKSARSPHGRRHRDEGPADRKRPHHRRRPHDARPASRKGDVQHRWDGTSPSAHRTSRSCGKGSDRPGWKTTGRSTRATDGRATHTAAAGRGVGPVFPASRAGHRAEPVQS
jgi:hypothetical protein